MNHTTLAVAAVIVALTFAVGTIAVRPALAYTGGTGGESDNTKGSDGTKSASKSGDALGDGNTVSKLKNHGKAIASGFGTIAANVQSNAICFVVAACI
jgi:hypothetical protein